MPRELKTADELRLASVSVSWQEWQHMPALLRRDILLLATTLAEYERQEIEKHKH